MLRCKLPSAGFILVKTFKSLYCSSGNYYYVMSLFNSIYRLFFRYVPGITIFIKPLCCHKSPKTWGEVTSTSNCHWLTQSTRVLCGHPGWSPRDHAHHLYVTIIQWRVSVPPCAVREYIHYIVASRFYSLYLLYTNLTYVYINIHTVHLTKYQCRDRLFLKWN